MGESGETGEIAAGMVVVASDQLGVVVVALLEGCRISLTVQVNLMAVPIHPLVAVDDTQSLPTNRPITEHRMRILLYFLHQTINFKL